MSVFTKIVTGVFGKKSDRDMKILTPYIGKINSIYDELNHYSDDELKQRFQDVKNKHGETALHLAAGTGRINIMKQLIKFGSNGLKSILALT